MRAGGEEGEEREEVGGEEGEQHEEVEQRGRAEARQAPPDAPGGRHVQGHRPHRAAAAPLPARAGEGFRRRGWRVGSRLGPRGEGVWVRRVRVRVCDCACVRVGLLRSSSGARDGTGKGSGGWGSVRAGESDSEGGVRDWLSAVRSVKQD